MKKIILIIIILISFLYFFYDKNKTSNILINSYNSYSLKTSTFNHDKIAKAYKNHQSNIQVKGKGSVLAILKDDNKGTRHQRFILKLPSGQTLLIAHNIDMAPRIDTLNKKDTVIFYGEYEWNNKGGIIHWTHHASKNNHINGWLKHKDKIYQ